MVLSGSFKNFFPHTNLIDIVEIAAGIKGTIRFRSYLARGQTVYMCGH
jgi:hypothetical protein